MKKKLKVILSGFIIILLIVGTLAYFFGSTTHATLKGDVSMKLDTFMEQFSLENDFHGVVLVAKDGEILLNQGYGLANRQEHLPNKVDTKFPIASLTKSFTAISILQLEEQGLLSISDPVATYLPDFPKGEKITIHHLLSHTSGIPEYFIIDGLDKTKVYTLDDLINLTMNEELLFEPGEKFAYSNSGYALLGKIIELVSGQSYNDYIQTNIFNRVGMDNSYLVQQEGSDVAVGYTFEGGSPEAFDLTITLAAGNIISTTQDLYRYDRAIKEGLLISHEQIEKMEKKYVDSAPLGVVGYGYGWYIMESFISFGKKTSHTLADYMAFEPILNDLLKMTLP